MPDLVGHDRKPSAFLVYLFLWTRTTGGDVSVKLSLRRIAEGAGLSRRAVQDALAHLSRRGLVNVERDGLTAVPRYTLCRPWRR